ncbi:MAG: pyridoxamine 5'-phosphate oxidase family protein [Methylococcaceae bacterium]
MNEIPEEVYQSLLQRVKSLQLATVDKAGKPRSSYAPFVRGQHGQFYIFISQLAGHTKDLLVRPSASILVIEDEESCQQLFARTRASFNCYARTVAPNEPEFASTLELFTATFGEVMQLLRSFPDFTLFCLEPNRGRFVMGFGQAYELTGDDMLTLLPVSSQTPKLSPDPN